MNSNYHIEQINRSRKNTVIAAGLIAAHFLAYPAVRGIEGFEEQLYRRNSYGTASALPTFSRYKNIVTGEYDQGKDALEEALSDVYARLLISQESLGPVFEKVLHDNLWNLYES